VGQGGAVSAGMSAGGEVVRGAGPAIVAAIVLFVGIWALERWRLDVLDLVRLDRGWLARTARRPTVGSAYDTGLQARAGVGGVFFALYFMAISTVAANHLVGRRDRSREDAGVRTRRVRGPAVQNGSS
jgi:hypothetical protein